MADADCSELPVTPTFPSAPSLADQPGASSPADQNEETGGDPRSDELRAKDIAPALDDENEPSSTAPARRWTSHIYPKPIPRDLSQDFSIFTHRIPVGFYPWSRSYLGPAYARIAEASTSFPVPSEGPDSGRRVSPLCVSDPSRGCSPPHAPLEGSFHVWPWGSLDNRPRGLSHDTPLGGCYVTCQDPSPAHAVGSCHH